MIYILKNKVIIVCLVISLLIGIFIGYGMESDFIVLYMNKLSSNSFVYILLVLTVYSEYIIFNSLKSSCILIRKRSHLYHFLRMLRCEVIILILIFLVMHIPIFIFNFYNAIKYIYVILLNFVNFIIISILFLSIIRLIDIKLKRREIASITTLLLFSGIHLLFEEFIFAVDIGFTLNYIFVLPFIYQHYIVIMILLIFLIIVFSFLFLILLLKRDYYLGCDFCEEI